MPDTAAPRKRVRDPQTTQELSSNEPLLPRFKIHPTSTVPQARSWLSTLKAKLRASIRSLAAIPSRTGQRLKYYAQLAPVKNLSLGLVLMRTWEVLATGSLPGFPTLASIWHVYIDYIVVTIMGAVIVGITVDLVVNPGFALSKACAARIFPKASSHSSNRVSTLRRALVFGPAREVSLVVINTVPMVAGVLFLCLDSRCGRVQCATTQFRRYIIVTFVGNVASILIARYYRWRASTWWDQLGANDNLLGMRRSGSQSKPQD